MPLRPPTTPGASASANAPATARARHRVRWSALIAGIGALGLLGAFTIANSQAAESGSASSSAAAALPAYDHVVVVVYENKQYGEIMGSANAPTSTSWRAAARA